MKYRIGAVSAVLVALILSLSACIGPVVEDSIPNQLPVISCGALHSPNGVEQHDPWEWDIYGAGYDPDGTIELWVIRIDGTTYRVGNNQDPVNRPEKSEFITHKFPGPGWYPLSITAFDNDGESTYWEPVYTADPQHDGKWWIRPRD